MRTAGAGGAGIGASRSPSLKTKPFTPNVAFAIFARTDLGEGPLLLRSLDRCGSVTAWCRDIRRANR